MHFVYTEEKIGKKIITYIFAKWYNYEFLFCVTKESSSLYWITSKVSPVNIDLIDGSRFHKDIY